MVVQGKGSAAAQERLDFLLRDGMVRPLEALLAYLKVGWPEPWLAFTQQAHRPPQPVSSRAV